ISATDIAKLLQLSYRLKFHISEAAISALKQVFPETLYPGIVHCSPKTLQTTAKRLSGYDSVFYDCCANVCIAYTMEFSELFECPFCKKPRYNQKGKPLKQFPYLPLIPRLQGMYLHAETAKMLRYRASFREETAGNISDVFSGTHYQKLCTTSVTIGGYCSDYNYFSDQHDVALAFSLDGVSVFKKNRPTC
ncbi:hypothetical protein DFJ73DRAFT_607807, partial [Zopfochytrium polystomum]